MIKKKSYCEDWMIKLKIENNMDVESLLKVDVMLLKLVPE